MNGGGNRNQLTEKKKRETRNEEGRNQTQKNNKTNPYNHTNLSPTQDEKKQGFFFGKKDWKGAKRRSSSTAG